MEPRRLFVVPVALATVALTLVLSGSASAATPPCGSLITENTTLTEDLHCSGDGLVLVGFVDVTLDLNGHTISGDGSGIGITVSAAESATVSVKNGSVRGFGEGIFLSGGFDSGTAQLKGLTIRDNGVGLGGFQNLAATLADSKIVDNRGTGVSVAFMFGFKMVNDQVRNNGGDGISAGEDSLQLLQDSFIAHNGGAGATLSDTVAVVSGNTFLGNAGTGLSIDERICSFFPLYFVGDNFAVQNGGGGMSMVPTSPDCSPPPPPGTGNAAQNNDVFQCVLIVCAKNRGLAKKPDPELIRRAESVRHAGATAGN